jgi:anti-anti-sigma regulatory factor
MEYITKEVQGKVPVTVLAIKGELDGSNFTQVIAIVKRLYDEGARHLLLDFSELTFLSSAGLVAVHSAALIMRGENPPDLEEGWGAFRAMGRDVSSGTAENVIILNPQPRVTKTLDTSGMSQFIQIFSDREAAIGAFKTS